ncbi:DEAD/DEAH box helicase [Roseibium denhamense]|uniref:Superfamily II DNA and RNA helicase n=1 Tax=Roseibium denhamense TaxID=76305 RepID=A0ABY1PGY9_9HYPH|nr:DEAD/DEAH box helicase [Roseibium denhamense]MTI06178.1 DEAD/DEAH box helicase [Roseibium denhamense]SMP32397.1 Superfamily II DNA and RNA helicase [Roseibium denhamense]
MAFDTLGLSEKVLAAVEAAGYKEPTAIQSGAIPQVLERRDILGIAQTGTGKTASFTLPMLTLLEKGRARARMPRTLILEPTRELAAQVQENFEKYGTNHKLNVALLIGGVSFAEQDKKLDRGTDVLIATPGRLLDHFERGKLLLQGVEILVIDEADRMLDMGFIPDIERICKLIPFTRQTLFFSATMPPEIQRLTETFLQNPARIEVAPTSSTNDSVTQVLKASQPKDFEKRETLRELLQEAEDLKNAIVFCNRKRDVSTLFRSLERHDYSVGALHGDMDQRTRMMMLDNFRKGTIKLLVASDVAARGLDIPEVSHVFNFDVPINAEDYVHRIGRTGRAGRKGTAYTLVTGDDQKYLSAIEALIKKSIDWQGEPIDFEEAAKERKSRRKSGKSQKAKTNDNEAAEAPAKPARRQRGGSKSRSESVEQPEVQTEQAGPSPVSNISQRQPVKKQKNSRQEPAFGAGVHIPAFLLREPRPKKAS